MKNNITKRLLEGWFCLILGLVGIGCGGAAYLVTIQHPMKERIPPDKYKSILVAGFLAEEDKLNLNFETVKYLRTELRKNTPYKVIEEKPIEIPSARIEELPSDTDFWKSLAIQAKAELIMWGRINYTAEPTAELKEMSYRHPVTGRILTATQLVERTNFKVELDLYFSDGSSGEVVYQDKYSQTIPYKERPSADLPIFFNLMNRILPSILGVLIPQKMTDARYILSD